MTSHPFTDEDVRQADLAIKEALMMGCSNTADWIIQSVWDSAVKRGAVIIEDRKSLLYDKPTYHKVAEIRFPEDKT